MNAAILPDFLRLSDEEIAREKQRQDRLRQEFNSRVRLSPAEHEMARAMIQHDDLKRAMDESTPEEMPAARARYAECLAHLGRFAEAAEIAPDETAREFYQAVAEAVHSSKECDCTPLNKMPKHRTLKEVHSIKLGRVAAYVECNRCGNKTVIA
jgi:hypothetical protein